MTRGTLKKESFLTTSSDPRTWKLEEKQTPFLTVRFSWSEMTHLVLSGDLEVRIYGRMNAALLTLGLLEGECHGPQGVTWLVIGPCGSSLLSEGSLGNPSPPSRWIATWLREFQALTS